MTMNDNTSSIPPMSPVSPMSSAPPVQSSKFRAPSKPSTYSKSPESSEISKPRDFFSVEVVDEALGYRAEDLFRLVFGEPVRSGSSEWRDKKKLSKTMCMQGSNRGLWYDFVTAEGGNLFDLVALNFLGLKSARDNFPKVLREAARYCGIAADQPVDMRALKARAAEREKQAKKEEERKFRQRMTLVKNLLKQTVPIAGTAGHKTPSRVYLASRGITEFPKTGLGDLPPVPGLAVAEANYHALVVWAKNSGGKITGGQRILINPDGSKVDIDRRKPSFGFMRGSVAQFPSRTGLADRNAPLVIAEGPESALSIWQSTGYETWAVFGSSGWKHAPIPLNRPVILAPDRDAPGSPADQALYKAVIHHLARGCDPRIAIAPEDVGSKCDLNDTLMRANGGAAEVRKAIDMAIPVPADMKQEALQERKEQMNRQVKRQVNTPGRESAEHGDEDAPSSHHRDAGDGPGF